MSHRRVFKRSRRDLRGPISSSSLSSPLSHYSAPHGRRLALLRPLLILDIASGFPLVQLVTLCGDTWCAEHDVPWHGRNRIVAVLENKRCDGLRFYATVPLIGPRRAWKTARIPFVGVDSGRSKIRSKMRWRVSGVWRGCYRVCFMRIRGKCDDKMIRVFFTARRRCAVEQQALGMSSAEQDAP
jgi:hypothetical protein